MLSEWDVPLYVHQVNGNSSSIYTNKPGMDSPDSVQNLIVCKRVHQRNITAGMPWSTMHATCSVIQFQHAFTGTCSQL